MKNIGLGLNVVYQPQIRLDTGQIVGAEALVRLVGTGKTSDTSAFIADLETRGGIEEVDAYVFEIACRDLREFLIEFPTLRFSGNASRKTLEQPGFAEKFSGLATKYEIPTSAIVAEITESYFSADMHKIKNTVQKLRKCGFSVVLDDFGKGGSCLSFLNDVECDGIKLDKFFLGNFGNPRTRTILDWTLELASRLEIDALAEGIETPEQAEYLRERGCRFGQGYYYACPMRFDEFRALLKDENFQRRRTNENDEP